VTTTSNMFEAICNHIKYSTNKGNIRLVYLITRYDTIIYKYIYVYVSILIFKLSGNTNRAPVYIHIIVFACISILNKLWIRSLY